MPVSQNPDLQMGPLSARLCRLANLQADDVRMLQLAEQRRASFQAKREMMVEGELVRERRALLSGWACRQRILADGRRQIIGFVLPGELIGVCQHSAPLASTTILAITDLMTCPAPMAESGTGLAEAYARSAALEEHHLMSHIVRLGRLNAAERIADWLLEIRSRLELTSSGSTSQIPIPLTQEMLADALGLTAVHVSRTLQAMRRDGLLTSQGGMVSLLDPERLEKFVNYRGARISIDNPR